MVTARRGLGAGIVVVSVVTSAVVVGCASKAARQKAQPAPSSPVARSGASAPAPQVNGSQPQWEPAQPGDDLTGGAEILPRSLADHTDAYARNVESLLAKRAAGSTRLPNVVDVSTLPADDSVEETEAPSTAANTAMRIDQPTTARSPADAVATAPTTQPASPDAETASAKTSAKPQPAAVPAGLKTRLEQRVKDDPRDAACQLDYQILQFLLDEPVPQLAPLASLPSEDRELLTTLLDGLANFRNGLRAEANMLQSKKVAPLLELADRLRSQADLALPAALLCKSVQRFGVYDPMEPPRFVSGRNDNDAILYCEVANFSSQLTADKMWETKLKQEAVLYSETGLSVWSDRSDTVTDLSRNRLHDFFIADKVRLPGNLPVGRYLLKMTVTDLHANLVAEATVPVQMVAQ